MANTSVSASQPKGLVWFVLCHVGNSEVIPIMVSDCPTRDAAIAHVKQWHAELDPLSSFGIEFTGTLAITEPVEQVKDTAIVEAWPGSK